MPSLADTKSSIRRMIRQKRQALSDPQMQQAGQALAQQIHLRQIIKAQHKIATFLAFDQEIPTQAVIEQIFTANASCFLPKLRPLAPNRLWFMPYTDATLLSANRYGINEVDLSVNHAIAISQLDIIFMPLVAFDATGNRLGMGGGFYDATLAHLTKTLLRPKLIGLAYEFQRQHELPHAPWDITLDGVCTEQGFYDFTAPNPNLSTTAPPLF